MADGQNALQAFEQSFAPAAEPAAQTPAPAPATQGPVDLDGLSEFSYQGEKYTPEKFNQVMQEYKSLSPLKDQSKYWTHLQADLATIKKRPDLADVFRKQYPESFHGYLDVVLQNDAPGEAEAVSSSPAIPKEFMDKFNNLERTVQSFEQRAHQSEVKANIAKIDAILPPLLSKYKLASEGEVWMRAETLSSQGVNVTEAVWERLVRESHEQIKKAADSYYGEILKSQTEKGQRGADVAPGGSTPGQAPVRPRTFDEAEAAMLRHMKQQRA